MGTVQRKQLMYWHTRVQNVLSYCVSCKFMDMHTKVTDVLHTSIQNVFSYCASCKFMDMYIKKVTDVLAYKHTECVPVLCKL